jgi:hypothetical protein
MAVGIAVAARTAASAAATLDEVAPTADGAWVAAELPVLDAEELHAARARAAVPRTAADSLLGLAAISLRGLT